MESSVKAENDTSQWSRLRLITRSMAPQALAVVSFSQHSSDSENSFL